jgi:phosphoribosylformylglycinamidine synthase
VAEPRVAEAPRRKPAGLTAESFPGERSVTPEVVREHNLNDLEYDRIVKLLGRTPTLTELGIF